MTRLMFLFTWLQGPRVFSRFILFFMLGMLFLFYCLVGGFSYVPAAPAHAIKKSVSGHAEAKSDSPEHGGSDAQEDDQRPSERSSTSPRLRVLQSQCLTNSALDVVFLPPFGAFVR